MPMSLTSLCMIWTLSGFRWQVEKVKYPSNICVKVFLWSNSAKMDGLRWKLTVTKYITSSTQVSSSKDRPLSSETVYYENKSEFQKNYLLIFFKTVHFQDLPVSMYHMIHRWWIFKPFSTAVSYFFKTSFVELKTQLLTYKCPISEGFRMRKLSMGVLNGGKD